MKAAYVKAMDGLYLLCMIIAGLSLMVMTIIIPIGVYFRYVLNSALAWPEPLCVLLMVLFTFTSAAACYRAGVHINVGLVTDAMPPAARRATLVGAELLLALISIFMVYWGLLLVDTTSHQVIGEFPFLSVGITYMPIPIGGALTLLFIIERLWIGRPGSGSFIYREPGEIN